MTNTRLFPLKLPSDFHGKPREKMPSIHRKKAQQWQNPESRIIKPQRWEPKRLDRDVIQERKELIISTSRVSSDAPDWLKNTFHYYRRDKFPKKNKQHPLEQSNYDVINQKRTISYVESYQPQNYQSSNRSNKSKCSSRGSSFNQKVYHSNMLNRNNEVSPKVGSLDIRDYTIKKPLLKIGKDGYIDTYSPF